MSLLFFYLFYCDILSILIIFYPQLKLELMDFEFIENRFIHRFKFKQIHFQCYLKLNNHIKNIIKIMT